MEKQRVLKRISIRNKHSQHKNNPRLFDVVLTERNVFLEIKNGKDQMERIPYEEIVRQIENVVFQEQHNEPQRTTAP